ncbi:hypothetical protein V6D40_09755 [Corynebacterium sp. Q4381]|uniref:hypothetical protein n=1 Tax=Corynebacterium sp. Marseille-Q4381 TaxID=3121597 RepID=UPI002FE68F42
MTWPIFWHQFKAGPWWRFVAVGLFAAFMSLAPIFASPLLAMLTPAIAATLWFLVFLPDTAFAQSYGLTRAQARRVFAFGAVPAGLLASVPALTRLDAGGVLGAALAWLVTAAMVGTSLPNGEPKRRIGGEGARFKGSSLEFPLFWRLPLAWGLGSGLAVGLAAWIGRGIGHETIRQVLIAFPVIVMWFALLGAPGLQPATVRSLGMTRKAWASRCFAVAIGVNLVFLAAAGSIWMLIDAPLTPLATTTAISAAVVFASHALMPTTEFVAFALPVLFFFPTRMMLDPLVPADRDALIATAVLGAIAVVAGLVVMALYVAGRVNVSRRSESFSGVNQRA